MIRYCALSLNMMPYEEIRMLRRVYVYTLITIIICDIHIVISQLFPRMNVTMFLV